eukprot:5349589-Prymnesium_polylepis.1
MAAGLPPPTRPSTFGKTSRRPVPPASVARGSRCDSPCRIRRTTACCCHPHRHYRPGRRCSPRRCPPAPPHLPHPARPRPPLPAAHASRHPWPSRSLPPPLSAPPWSFCCVCSLRAVKTPLWQHLTWRIPSPCPVASHPPPYRRRA